MRELVSRKKYVAHNYDFNVGEITCFCRYTVTSAAILIVSYYMPKDGFSVIWGNTDKVILTDVSEMECTRKRKYTRVTFLVHPTYYSGQSFDDDSRLGNLYVAINKLFAERLKYLEPEKHVRKS